MKKIFIISFFIISIKGVIFGQTPLDTITQDENSTVIHNNNAVLFRNDTFFVNSSTHFLHKYYNFELSEDSILNISDTILKKITDVYIIDTISNTTLKISKQVISFNWAKKIPFNSNFITPPTTAYKTTVGRWDDCTYYIYVYGISKVCFAVMVCDLPDYDTYSWCSGVKYTKIYEDNFSGNSIDLDHWKVGYDWGRENQPSTEPDASIALNRNVEVSSGTLKLKTQTEGSQIIDNDGTTYPSRPFSDGVITSVLSYGYGKYSMRAKVPQSVGVNPAYWLMGNDLEIDGFEFFLMNRDDAPYMTVYSNNNTNLTGGPCFGYDGKSKIFQQIAHKNIWNNLPNLSNNWYIYTLVYDPNYITWFIETDDHLQSWKLTYPYVQQQNQSNIDPNQNCSCTGCVVQVNANFPSNNGNLKFIINNSATQSLDFTNGDEQQLGPYPNTVSTMEIDWVKIYVPDNCWTDVIESTGKFRAIDHNNRNHVTGNNITLGGNGTNTPADEYKIHFAWYNANDAENTCPRTFCAARANNELKLLDGFSVEENALFEGSISFQGGNGGVPSDCNNQTYWPQIYRNTNNTSIKDSISSTNKNKDIQIYPNPANNYISITAQIPIKKIELYNSIGQIILSINDTKDKINIDSIIDGMYIIKVYFENHVTVSKFIKKSN